MWLIEDSPLGRIVVPPVIPPNAAVFCTTRDYPGRVVADEICRFIHGRFGLETSLTTCVQVHGATVVRAEHGRSWRECDSCDALWSDQRYVTLGIKIADCLPIGIIDPVHGVIGNAHSGWRGAVQHIAAATLDAMRTATAFDATTAYAYLGPSIRSCCFEVGEEVAAQFDDAFVVRTGAKPHVDLIGFTAAILRARGFDGERILDSGLCTRCEGSIFHSYRRDGAGGGRNLMFVSR